MRWFRFLGIMLLEKQLLTNVDSGASRPAKRARGAAGPLPETTTTWVELSRYSYLHIRLSLVTVNWSTLDSSHYSPYLPRLYKSLGDYDVLRGVFSGHVGTKSITQEALEAEERADYVEALRLYKDVSILSGFWCRFLAATIGNGLRTCLALLLSCAMYEPKSICATFHVLCCYPLSYLVGYGVWTVVWWRPHTGRRGPLGWLTACCELCSCLIYYSR